MSYIQLSSRSVIALYGPDTKTFLQGIITNDINKLDSQKAIYSLLLNPQGRYLYDFFLINHDKYIILECEKRYVTEIIGELNLLKTYLRVKIKDISKLHKVGVLLNNEYSNKLHIAFYDPRHESLGIRVIHKDDMGEPIGEFSDYEKIRISNIIPDGVRDMVQNSSFPLQYLIDKVNGIDFNKGCYIGQEVVNRMSRQLTLRRHLYFIQGNSTLTDIGTKVTNSNREEVGELRSSIDNIGLALLNTEKVQENLYVGKTKISVRL